MAEGAGYASLITQQRKRLLGTRALPATLTRLRSWFLALPAVLVIVAATATGVVYGLRLETYAYLDASLLSLFVFLGLLLLAYVGIGAAVGWLVGNTKDYMGRYAKDAENEYLKLLSTARAYASYVDRNTFKDIINMDIISDYVPNYISSEADRNTAIEQSKDAILAANALSAFGKGMSMSWSRIEIPYTDTNLFQAAQNAYKYIRDVHKIINEEEADNTDMITTKMLSTQRNATIEVVEAAYKIIVGMAYVDNRTDVPPPIKGQDMLISRVEYFISKALGGEGSYGQKLSDYKLKKSAIEALQATKQVGVNIGIKAKQTGQNIKARISDKPSLVKDLEALKQAIDKYLVDFNNEVNVLIINNQLTAFADADTITNADTLRQESIDKLNNIIRKREERLVEYGNELIGKLSRLNYFNTQYSMRWLTVAINELEGLSQSVIDAMYEDINPTNEYSPQRVDNIVNYINNALKELKSSTKATAASPAPDLEPATAPPKRLIPTRDPPPIPEAVFPTSVPVAVDDNVLYTS